MKANVFIVASFSMLPSALLAFPRPSPPPPTGCPPTALCTLVPQLFTIPAFFPISEHSDLSKQSDWVRIQNAGGWVQNVVALGARGGFEEAALASDCPPLGSGGELCDAKAQFQANFQANQFVFGYINTQFATRPFGPGTPFQTELLAWQQRFPSQIQGMFLDNGPTFDPSQSTLTDAQFRQYYIPLYTMLKGPQFSWQVQLNASQYPGQDANGGPSDWILSAPAADSVVVFEQSANVYFNEYGAIYPGGFVQPAPAWWSTAAPNYKTAHVLSNATQYDVQKVADLTSSRSATLVYVFDGNSGAYDHVSCYFEQEVAYLQNHQSTGGAGKTWCASSAACSDLRSDTNNCGACDNVCDPGWSCQSSKCVPPACPSGYRACPDATCVRLPGNCF